MAAATGLGVCAATAAMLVQCEPNMSQYNRYMARFEARQGGTTYGFDRLRSGNNDPSEEDIAKHMAEKAKEAQQMSKHTTTSTPVGEQDCDIEMVFLKFCKTLSPTSANSYINRVKAYKIFCLAKKMDMYDTASAFAYIVDLRETSLWKATTLWCEQAKLGAWFVHVQKIKLLDREPGLTACIKQWQKTEEIKKAETLSKEDFESFLGDAPNDAHCLLIKCIAIISVFGLQRRCETTATMFEDVEDKTDCFLITMHRRKGTGNKKDTSFAITDKYCMGVLRKYISCFAPDDRVGRFFRFLLHNHVTGVIKGTKNVCGVNTIGANMMKIATYLGKKNPKKNTSHGARR